MPSEYKKYDDLRRYQNTLNLKTALQILPNISEGNHSIKEIASKMRLNSRIIINLLTNLGIGVINGGNVFFKPDDRFTVALIIAKHGISLNEISRCLTWRDFEHITSKILEEYGYATIRNIHLTKPRFEIDILGFKSGFGLVVDCKHWKHNLGLSKTDKVAISQKKRSQALMKSHYAKDLSLDYVLPVIITLYAEIVSFIYRIPIVPVDKISSFLNEVDGHLSDLTLVKDTD